MKQRLFIEAFC